MKSNNLNSSGQTKLFGIVIMVLMLFLIPSCATAPQDPLPSSPTNTLESTQVPTALARATQTDEAPQPIPTIKIEPPPEILEAGQVWINPIDGMEMVGVPEGEFPMGRNDEDSDEGPAHNVYLDAYYIDKLEVSNSQYRQCADSGMCMELEKRTYIDDPTYNQHPAVNVTWHWANQYCRWAGKRLPTEAEWEKAARGADGRRYPWGNMVDCDHAHFKDCGGQTVPVGSFPKGASPYGALDMAGNVWEWVIDEWQEDYYQVSPTKNPQGPKNPKNIVEIHVFRGGSWSETADLLRSTYRTWYEPNAQYYNLGFRCVIDAP